MRHGITLCTCLASATIMLVVTALVSSCADPSGESLETGVAEGQVQEFDGGLRAPNHAPLPSADSPDYGRIAFLRDGGAPDGNSAGFPSGLHVVNNANRWSHISSNQRVYNVLDYGAKPDDGFFDNGPALQAAINAAAAGAQRDIAIGGAIVQLPPGEYFVTSGITIPRLSGGKSLAIHGAGVGATQITASITSITTPVLTFDTSTNWVDGYSFSDMTIARTNAGTLIRHSSGGDGQRLSHSTFRNLGLFAPAADTSLGEQFAVLEIVGGAQSHFENIVALGGESAFLLANSSHCVVTNFHVAPPRSGGEFSHVGLRVQGGGSHVITNFRADQVDGTGIAIQSSSNVLVNGIQNEGKLTKNQVLIQGAPGAYASDILINQVAIALPCLQTGTNTCSSYCGALPSGKCDDSDVPRYGIVVGSYARNVRITGGRLSGWGTEGGAPGDGNAIYIQDGAEHVTIEGMHFMHGVGYDHPLDLGSGSIVQIDGAAKDIRIRLVDGLDSAPWETGWKRWERDYGTVGAIVAGSCADASTAHVYAYDVMETTSAGSGPGAVVDRLIQGTRKTVAPCGEALPSAGRTLTLIGRGDGVGDVSLGSGGNILFATPHTGWDGLTGETLRLVYDGANWLELSRSATP
jgi:hypothetical protein